MNSVVYPTVTAGEKVSRATKKKDKMTNVLLSLGNYSHRCHGYCTKQWAGHSNGLEGNQRCFRNTEERMWKREDGNSGVLFPSSVPSSGWGLPNGLEVNQR